MNQHQPTLFSDFNSIFNENKDYIIMYEDYNTRSQEYIKKNYTYDTSQFDLNLILLYKWYAKINSGETYYLGSSYCDYLCNHDDFLFLEDQTEVNKIYIEKLINIYTQSKKMLEYDNSLIFHMQDTTNILFQNEINEKYPKIGYPIY